MGLILQTLQSRQRGDINPGKGNKATAGSSINIQRAPSEYRTVDVVEKKKLLHFCVVVGTLKSQVQG